MNEDQHTLQQDGNTNDDSCCSNTSCCPPSAPPFTRTNPKIGRNAPCPCGSTQKFKKCCGRV
ncbi:SEC-C metal-binding domain-containing protein [Agaribacterium sp. ZY112]|uniref:SEC-C metal-binding domain-containing protein n=1 Tax=Agaribacterium sp. ZY112 TaxID=3233574 RepID=UPI003524F260